MKITLLGVVVIVAAIALIVYIGKQVETKANQSSTNKQKASDEQANSDGNNGNV